MFTVRNNILSAKEEQFGKYAVVALARSPALFTNEWIERHALSEYVSEYYGFSETWMGSETLLSTPTPVYEPWGIPFVGPFDGAMPFTLLAYSDIEKSTHFRFGDRGIIDGRFAQDTSECNISTELSQLNGLSVGDTIEIYMYYDNPIFFSFKIVGIYADYTTEISNELPLVTPRVTGKGIHEGMPAIYTERVSQDNISRNQILTAAPSSTDLAVLGVSSYSVAVYFVHDEKSILEYIETIDLPNQLMIFDSADMRRYVHHVLDRTAISFDRILLITYLINVIFGTLIIFYILKARAYDIGSFRARGMSRTRTAFLLIGEIFAVFTLAFATAGVLYFTMYTPIASLFHQMQNRLISSDQSFWINFSPEVMNAAYEFKFAVSINPFNLIYGFIATIAHIIIVGFATTLFISRHEPMKTMTKV